MKGVCDAVADWSGGTRIGICLKEFNLRRSVVAIPAARLQEERGDENANHDKHDHHFRNRADRKPDPGGHANLAGAL